MAKSIYHPDAPHSIERLDMHPSFEMLSFSNSGRDQKKYELFCALEFLRARIAKQPERYRDGIDVKEFFAEFRTHEEADSVTQELHRMNVYRITAGANGNRLVPCIAEAEQAAAKRTKSDSLHFYMPLEKAEWYRSEGAKRKVPMNKIHDEMVSFYWDAHGIKAAA